jgi:hypothetical protein
MLVGELDQFFGINLDENPYSTYCTLSTAVSQCAEQHGGRLIGIGELHVRQILENVQYPS